jgi:hypothetical protein
LEVGGREKIEDLKVRRWEGGRGMREDKDGMVG